MSSSITSSSSNSFMTKGRSSSGTSNISSGSYLSTGSHMRMARMEEYSTFTVILKIHSRNIYVRSQDDKLSLNQLHSYRIYCHDLEDHNQSNASLYETNFNNEGSSPSPSLSLSSSKVQVFVLADSSKVTDRSNFQNQHQLGESIGPNDYTMFMSPVYDANRKASFAIDLGISNHTSSLEDLSEEECRKIGTAYMYLDPKFATQGLQRMQLIGAHSFAPIGHLQVEYLVVRNPDAYGVPLRKLDWLSNAKQIDQGHRGAGSGCRADLPGRITENTVASFNYAARHGADMCELDVMLTLDGVPVVYHDFRLEVDDFGVCDINQLTWDELRTRKLASIHDKNCRHSLQHQHETGISSSSLSLISSGLETDDEDHQPMQTSKAPRKEFNLTIPSLEEVLKMVDVKCALNVELKFPQMMANGKSEAKQNKEINYFVDTIIRCIDEFENGRPIMFSTLNPDIAILLRLKQSRYPVLFLTTADPSRFVDPLTKSTKSAIHFAKAFDMAGINPNVNGLNEKLVRYAQERGLLVYAWGKIETPQAIRELRGYGLNGIIYDRIDLIKPQDN